MIIGHQKQWNFLKSKFESGQLSHAYLFSGQDQLGKKFSAKEFIKLINCQSQNEKPCGVCFSCQRIEKENYPDFSIVKLKEGESEIQIAQIRELQNFLNYKSYYGSFKSAIVDDAELMSRESQSCFLKTLEEPKGKTLLILTVSDPAKLLNTISSRCQLVKFFPASKTEIKNYIKAQKVSGEKAELIAEMSEGRPGRAFEFIFNQEKLEKEKNDLKELLKVAGADLAEKFQYTKSFKEENSSLKELLEMLERYLRHLLLFKIGAKKPEDFNYFSELPQKIANYPVSKIKNILKLAENINSKISLTNASPKLALEILLMEF